MSPVIRSFKQLIITDRNTDDNLATRVVVRCNERFIHMVKIRPYPISVPATMKNNTNVKMCVKHINKKLFHKRPFLRHLSGFHPVLLKLGALLG